MSLTAGSTSPGSLDPTVDVRGVWKRYGDTDVVIDPAARTAHRAGRSLDLTTRELALLRYFVLHPGRLLAAEELIEHVWDANADPFSTSVRVILSRLRRKLGDPPIIHTVPGGGYRLGDPG